MVDQPLPETPSRAGNVGLFFVFLVVCSGLGYAPVVRYQPEAVGLRDVGTYRAMVLGQPVGAPSAYRLLTPTLARGVHAVVSRLDLGAWDPVNLSLLVVNSVFTALTALLLMHIAASVARDFSVALVAPWIYLSSYMVVNAHLAGLIDSAEAFFLVAMLYCLQTERWMAAPVLIGFGALTKETIVVFGLCGMAAWWLCLRCRHRPRWALSAMGLSAVAGGLVLGLCRHFIEVPVYEPQTFSWGRLAGIGPNLMECFSPRAHVYAFALLVPMSAFRLRRLPGPLLAASAAMAVAATLLGAYAAIGSNLPRPLFDTLAVVLVVASSMTLVDLARGRSAK